MQDTFTQDVLLHYRAEGEPKEHKQRYYFAREVLTLRRQWNDKNKQCIISFLARRIILVRVAVGEDDTMVL